MWYQLGVNDSNFDFWHNNLIDWLSLITRSNVKMHDTDLPWKFVFPFAIWNIWKSRNAFIFNGNARSHNLVVDVVYQAWEFLHCVQLQGWETAELLDVFGGRDLSKAGRN